MRMSLICASKIMDEAQSSGEMFGDSEEASTSILQDACENALEAFDLISLLPEELTLRIFAYLEAKDICRASQVCLSWCRFGESDLLWRNKNRQQGFSDRRADLPLLKHSLVRRLTRSLWKVNFARHFVVSRNWRYGSTRPVKELPAHQGHMITCLLLTDDNRIVSGSDDGIIKVWSVQRGQCLYTLPGHEAGIWAMEVEGSLLVSASVDRTVRIWNLETGELDTVMVGHAQTVRCLALKDGICVSGSRDCTLRVWNVGLDACNDWTSNKRMNGCLGVLMGHTRAIRCVRYNGIYIVSGSYDTHVRVWHPKEFICLMVLLGHAERLYALQFDGVHIVSGSLGNTIRIWDVKTGALKHLLVGHQMLSCKARQDEHVVITATPDSEIHVWNIQTGACILTMGSDVETRHSSGVTSVYLDETYVVSSADDGTCKLWDRRTGSFIRDIVRLPTREIGGVVWRITANHSTLVCAVGSRDRSIADVQETKLLLFNFDTET
ncbi:F-box/WD repeat-containing protein 7-like [Paramacrobiotus metropolitanus]|uniref:F-box/WD repeat-containing protein 7-like n=1 Tax=Paramacrobiotus metropolitanus TaxID=2943436 RepID=UPI002445EA3A|nr:F-box/WD repeat-containing protein 7-like [Paramacrobiotus metropolitanus]